MVVDNKGTVTYVHLLKEDLVIIRMVPNDDPVPDYKPGQFITLGLPNPCGRRKDCQAGILDCVPSGE